MIPRVSRRSRRLAAGGGALLALLAGCVGDRSAPDVSEAEARPPVVARATLEPPSATVGDRVIYSLEVDHEPGLTVSWPEIGEVLGGLRVMEQGLDEPRERGGRVFERRWYRLQAAPPGRFELPVQTVKSWAEGDEVDSGPSGEAPSTALEIASVLPPETEQAELRDIKPLDPPRPLWPWWALAAALVAAAILGLVLKRRRSGGGLDKVTPSVPPHETALRELERLAAVELSDRREARRFGFRVSEIVRTYVEGRWGLNATDLTSEEIRARLGELRELPAVEVERLEEFLEATDRVKYTGMEAPREELRRIHREAVTFVQASRPRETDDVAAG